MKRLTQLAIAIVMMAFVVMPILSDTLVLKTGERISGYYEGGTARLIKFRGPDGVVKDYDILSVQTLQFGEEKNTATSSSEAQTSTPVPPPVNKSGTVGSSEGTPPQGVGAGVVFKVGGGISAPTIIKKVDPQYSEEARKACYQGTVVLEAIVQNDGSVRVARVVRSLGFGLDEKAKEALQQWKFSPAKQNGVPVAVSLNIEVNFNLRQDKCAVIN